MLSAILSTAFAAVALAAPVVERQAAPNGPGDGVILNYALTLEHLENAFYKEGLAKFSQADFAAAGYDNVFYSNLKEISSDEETHVSFLSGALTKAGVTPVVPNTYAFGFNDIKTFLTIANVLEGVGVSAYLGAAQFIADATYLTAAGSILTVEARHSAYLRSKQQPQLSPFPTPFDVPLTFNEVVTLAAPFITAIAPENGPLPVAGFPAITAAPGAGKAGDKIVLTCAKDVEAKAAYFITVTGPVAAPLEGSGKTYTITIPKEAGAGQSYVVLTKSTDGTVTDDNTVAGPAIIEIADNQAGIVADVQKCVDGKPAGYAAPSAPAAPAASAPAYKAPVQQIGDGQVQQPAHPVQQIGDGQIQNPAAPVYKAPEAPKETAPVYKAPEAPKETVIYYTKVYTSYEAHPTATDKKEHPVVYTTVVEHKPTTTEHAVVYPTTTEHAVVYPTKDAHKTEEASTTCTESATVVPVYHTPAPVYHA